MARKNNALREIKGFGGTSTKVHQPVKSKQQAKTIPITKGKWEAWHCMGEMDNPTHWSLMGEGSLEDCFEELDEEIRCQLQEPMVQDGTVAKLDAKYSHEPEVIVEILERFTAPKINTLKQQCLEQREVQGDNWLIAASPSKFKRQAAQNYPFAYSDYWEVWEVNGAQGFFIADGTLSECLEEVRLSLTLEIDMQLDPSSVDDDMSEEAEIEQFFEHQGVTLRKRLLEIKSNCLTKGECKHNNWVIRSQRTREQCQWMAQHEYPIFM